MDIRNRCLHLQLLADGLAADGHMASVEQLVPP